MAAVLKLCCPLEPLKKLLKKISAWSLSILPHNSDAIGLILTKNYFLVQVILICNQCWESLALETDAHWGKLAGKWKKVDQVTAEKEKKVWMNIHQCIPPRWRKTGFCTEKIFKEKQEQLVKVIIKLISPLDGRIIWDNACEGTWISEKCHKNV